VAGICTRPFMMQNCSQIVHSTFANERLAELPKVQGIVNLVQQKEA
jgi:hypothetical protein